VAVRPRFGGLVVVFVILADVVLVKLIILFFHEHLPVSRLNNPHKD